MARLTGSRLKFGISIPNFGQLGKSGTVADLIRLADFADRLGFDSLWVSDHIVIPTRGQTPYPYNETGEWPFGWRQEFYEPLALLGALAATTKRIALGTSVIVVPYRNPLFLAKAVATLDCISHGRVLFGIGVGWMREEFEAVGAEQYFEHRGSVTDEWISICKLGWTDEGPSSFEGRYFRFQNIGIFPKPVQKPHPPIIIGGNGEIAARRVARYGNGFRPIGLAPEALKDNLVMVHRECERRNRDFDEIEVSTGVGVNMAEGAQAAIDRVGQYRDAGVHHVTLGFPAATGRSMTPQRLMDHFQWAMEEIVPAFR